MQHSEIQCMCVCDCVCVCVCVCVLDREGSWVFVSSVDSCVSDRLQWLSYQLQWLSDRFLWTTVITI